MGDVDCEVIVVPREAWTAACEPREYELARADVRWWLRDMHRDRCGRWM